MKIISASRRETRFSIIQRINISCLNEPWSGFLLHVALGCLFFFAVTCVEFVLPLNYSVRSLYSIQTLIIMLLRNVMLMVREGAWATCCDCTFRKQHFPGLHLQKSSQQVHACTAHDCAVCSKNRKIVPYHRDSPKTRNGARLVPDHGSWFAAYSVRNPRL